MFSFIIDFSSSWLVHVWWYFRRNRPETISMLELSRGTAPVTILSTAGTTFASAHMVQQIWYASTAGYSSWSLAIDSRSAARVEAILSSLGKAIPVTVIVKQVSRHLVAFCRYTVCSISTWTFSER